ncbi:MAG: hypothetical protein LBK68_00550 [Candidatus Margulisbacteria bacterium]|jgi:hypothetical protein|nr:hypothetical protein [Candidatus Margulisiibacteriota bacterium]
MLKSILEGTMKDNDVILSVWAGLSPEIKNLEYELKLPNGAAAVWTYAEGKEKYAQTVQQANELFDNTRIGKFLNNVMVNSLEPEFKNLVADITGFFEKNEIAVPKHRVYALALGAVTNFGGYSVIPRFDSWQAVANRMVTIVTGQGLVYETADRQTAEDVFALKTLSVGYAQSVYGQEANAPRNEAILMAGDATRFLEFVKKLNDRLTDNNFIGDKKFIGRTELSEGDLQMLEEILTTPALQRGVNAGDVHAVDENYNAAGEKIYAVEQLREAIAYLVARNVSLPKGMVDALCFEGQNTTHYINYMYLKVLRAWANAKVSGQTGSNIWLIVKDEQIKTALQAGVDVLRRSGVWDDNILRVNFLIQQTGVPAFKDDGTLSFAEDNSLDMVSTGHGATLIKAVNDIYETTHAVDDQAVPVSMQTIDNLGSAVYEYTALGQNGARYENEVRSKLAEIVYSEGTETEKMQQLLAYAQDISSQAGKSFTTRNDDTLATVLARFIEMRWDYLLDSSAQTKDNAKYVDDNKISAEQLMEQIKTLPITVAFVVAPAPGQKGGGLYVNAQTGRMSVVEGDSLAKDQPETAFYFNPLLYVVLSSGMSSEAESGLMILTVKGSKTKVETASTNIATDYTKALKVVVVIPEQDLARSFQQNKTLNETSINTPDQNRVKAIESLRTAIERDIHAIAETSGRTPEEVFLLFDKAQDVSVNAFFGRP